MNYPIGHIPQNLTTGQKQPSKPDIRPLVDASCQLRVKFINGESIPICSGTLIESNRVETSNHGVDEAMKIAKKNGGELVFRFNKVDVRIANFDSQDKKDDVEIIQLQIHVPISPAPPKGNPPNANVPLIFVHYPNGKLTVDNGELLTSTHKELILMGNYPSDKGSCGGSLYYQKGNEWVRLGHHRYASRINDGVKSFGTTPTPDLIMGGDKLADRLFDDIFGRAHLPLTVIERPQPSVPFTAHAQPGPDIPEGRYKFGNFTIIEEENRKTEKTRIGEITFNNLKSQKVKVSFSCGANEPQATKSYHRNTSAYYKLLAKRIQTKLLDCTAPFAVGTSIDFKCSLRTESSTTILSVTSLGEASTKEDGSKKLSKNQKKRAKRRK